MTENVRIAKEMLAVARMLMAGDNSDRLKYNQITKTKTTPHEYGQLKKLWKQGDEEVDDEFSDESMDKIAEELLSVASELMNEEN